MKVFFSVFVWLFLFAGMSHAQTLNYPRNVLQGKVSYGSGLLVTDTGGVNYVDGNTVLNAGSSSEISSTVSGVVIKAPGNCPSNFSTAEGCALIIENNTLGSRRIGMSIDSNYTTYFNFGGTLRLGGNGSYAGNIYFPATNDPRWNLGGTTSNGTATLTVTGKSSALAASIDGTGTVRLNAQSAEPFTCSATYKGTLAMTSTTTELCFCNGTSWLQVDSGSACSW